MYLYFVSVYCDGTFSSAHQGVSEQTERGASANSFNPHNVIHTEEATDCWHDNQGALDVIKWIRGKVKSGSQTQGPCSLQNKLRNRHFKNVQLKFQLLVLDREMNNKWYNVMYTLTGYSSSSYSVW